MSKNKFDPQTLDVILSDSDDVIHEVTEQIEEDKSLIKATQNSASVDIEKVYGELGNLVKVGNDVLQSAKYAVDMDPTAEGIITGTASLLSSIKDVIKEFSKIHLQNMKHEQQKEMETIKQAGREKLIELRATMKGDNQKDNIDILPFTQETIVKQIAEAEEVKEEEDQSDDL